MTELQREKTLPKGWHWAKLIDVCEIIMGQSPPGNTYRKTPQGMPFFQGKADFGEHHPVARTWCIAPSRIAKPGDILLSVRAPVGPTNIADVESCIGRGLAAIRSTEKTDRDFVLFALKFYEDDLVKKGSGSTFDSIRKEDLFNLEIPLPSLDEQKRIAALLDKQMHHIEQARQAAEESLTAAWELPSAYMKVVFEGKESKTWEKQRLAEITEIISGITLGRKLGEVKTRKVPYLRVANVKDGFLDLSDVYEIDATDADVKKCTLKYGDLLLTEGGDPDKLGRGTFWEEQIPECLHQNHIFRVRFDLNKFSPQFAANQFGSAYGKAYFLAHAKQTTGIATINQKVLGNFPFIIPPFDEQKRIAETIKAKIDEADKLMASLESQLAEINELPSALLRQAFAGEFS